MPRDRTSEARTIAVALHEIEPATFERCFEVRDWLQSHGVDRVTLLVIPARDLHPLGERSPEMVDWLIERRRLGDSIAQHGFQHEQLRRAGWSPHLLAPRRGRRAAEFVGLDDHDTRRAVEAGWRLLKLAGIEPDGFVAPAYAYTPALRDALSTRFRWWAGLLGLHGALAPAQSVGAPEEGVSGEEQMRSWRRLAPAWDLGAGGRLGGALPPAMIHAGAVLAGSTLRLDLHPTDLESPRGTRALERVLAHATGRRSAITYDELATAERTVERLEEDATSLPHRPKTPRLQTPPRPTSPRSRGGVAQRGSRWFAAARSR
jgi:predicted deacetylase